jgi:hypothetical protein
MRLGEMATISSDFRQAAEHRQRPVRRPRDALAGHLSEENRLAPALTRLGGRAAPEIEEDERAMHARDNPPRRRVLSRSPTRLDLGAGFSVFRSLAGNSPWR